jgi:hypothetical protein
MDITQNIEIPDLHGHKRRANVSEFRWIIARDDFGNPVLSQSKIIISIFVKWYYNIVVDQISQYGGEIEGEKPISKRLIKPYIREITADDSSFINAVGQFVDPSSGTLWVDVFPQYSAIIEKAKGNTKIFEDIRDQVLLAAYTGRLDYVVS